MPASEEIIPVSRSNHKNYSFKLVTSYQSDFEPFKSVSFCPICLSEINYVACNYPIVFITDPENEFQLVSLFSLLKNQNPFINRDNHWTGYYIPAFFRIHPFFLANTVDKKDKILCFPSSTSLIKKSLSDGFFPFFEKNGNLSTELNKILQMLQILDKNKDKSKIAIQNLNKCKLLTSWDVDIKFKEGNKKIEGLYRIDLEKLKMLSAQDLHDLNQNGGLAIAYAHIVSSTKLQGIGELHAKNGITEENTKSLRDKTIEKQKKEKKEELDQLVQNLFETD